MSEDKDIVERLLSNAGQSAQTYSDALMNEAASKITRLRGEVERLREALKPFGRVADSWDSVVAPCADDDVWTLCNPEGDCIPYDMKVGDFRRARALLPKLSEGE